MSSKHSSKHTHHHHHDHSEHPSGESSKKAPSAPEPKQKLDDYTNPETGRQIFWAHEELVYTDDPFEDDFCDNIKRPTRGK